MVLAFTIPNQNPVLGPAQGNKQEISVYDSKLGNHRTLVATPDECDKFVNDRQEALKKDSKRTLKTWIYSTLAGLGIGGVAGAVHGKKETKAINEIVSQLNAELKQGKNLAELKLPKKYSFDLNFMYDSAKNSFETLGVKNIAKKAGGAAAIVGAIAFTLGILASVKNSAKSTNQVEQEFITQHK